MYLETLLNLLISSNIFFVVVGLVFSLYLILLSINRTFHFLLSDLNVFYLFFCLISLSKTSSTMLNKSCENGYPNLVPNFKGSTFIFLKLILVFNDAESESESLSVVTNSWQPHGLYCP